MEYCISGRRNLKTAVVTGVGLLAPVPMKQAVLFALRAVNSFWGFLSIKRVIANRSMGEPIRFNDCWA